MPATSSQRPHAAIRRRIGQSLTICLPMLAVALSYGALAHSAGLHLWQTAFLATFALGGAAEILFSSTLLAGGAPLMAALGGILVNTRNTAFGMSVGTFAPTGWRRWFGAHLVNDEATAYSRLEKTDAGKWSAFVILGVMMLFFWVFGALMGYQISGQIDTQRLGVDAAFPVLLTAMVLSDLRSKPMLPIAIIGGVIALSLTPVLPAGIGGITALIALVLWPLLSLSREPSSQQNEED